MSRYQIVPVPYTVQSMFIKQWLNFERQNMAMKVPWVCVSDSPAVSTYCLFIILLFPDTRTPNFCQTRWSIRKFTNFSIQLFLATFAQLPGLYKWAEGKGWWADGKWRSQFPPALLYCGWNPFFAWKTFCLKLSYSPQQEWHHTCPHNTVKRWR